MTIKRELADTLALRIQAETELKEMVEKKATKATIIKQLDKIQQLEEKEKEIMETAQRLSFITIPSETNEFDTSIN